MDDKPNSLGRAFDSLAATGGFAGAIGMGVVLYCGLLFVATATLGQIPMYAAMDRPPNNVGLGMVTQAAPFALVGACLPLVYVWVRRTSRTAADAGFRVGAGMIALVALGILIPCANEANRFREAAHKSEQRRILPAQNRNGGAQ